MTPLRFIPPTYEGDRRLLLCGQVAFGAVFPPLGNNPGRHPWVWRLWIGATGTLSTAHGRASTEGAACNALLAAARDWIRRAGLVEVRDE